MIKKVIAYTFLITIIDVYLSELMVEWFYSAWWWTEANTYLGKYMFHLSHTEFFEPMFYDIIPK